jgi:wobble nucleotide-excising tRNase
VKNEVFARANAQMLKWVRQNWAEIDKNSQKCQFCSAQQLLSDLREKKFFTNYPF